MLRFVFAGAALVLVTASGAPDATAQTAASLTPDEIIATRQALMDLQGGVAAAMKAAVDGKEDVKPLTAGAKALSSSSKVIPALFPAGTEKGHDTKAKPDVWSDKAGFEKAAAALTTQADKLAAFADANDKAGFATQFAEVGKACGGCHRPYRYQQ